MIDQRQVLAPNAPLVSMLERGALSSLIMLMPAGVGKTTVARFLANHTDLHFEQISAIFNGISELKKCIETAKLRASTGRGTLLLLMKFIGLIRGSRMRFYHIWKTALLYLWGRQRKTLLLS